jgi:GNAT superfamily N-acetyltransferase
VDAGEVARAGPTDAAELLVLQRCCWVDEALANDTLDIAPLHEALDDVQAWLAEWTTWCVRSSGRLVGAVRARRDGRDWEIGRLMVAPDLSGRGLGRWLLAWAEAHAPADVERLTLFTGVRSVRNIRMYERAGYRTIADPAPPSAVWMVKPIAPGAA